MNHFFGLVPVGGANKRPWKCGVIAHARNILNFVNNLMIFFDDVGVV